MRFAVFEESQRLGSVAWDPPGVVVDVTDPTARGVLALCFAGDVPDPEDLLEDGVLRIERPGWTAMEFERTCAVLSIVGSYHLVPEIPSDLEEEAS